MTRPGTPSKVLLGHLPAYPDKLMRGSDGKIWLDRAKGLGGLLQ